MKEVEFERHIQELRNRQYEELKRKQNNEKEKKDKYVKGLRNQIQDKKEEVYSSREEFLKDKEMVNEVVNKLIEEEKR